MTTWTAIIEQDPLDETGCLLTFPNGMIDQLGWSEGDQIKWIPLDNNSVELRKVTAVADSLEYEQHEELSVIRSTPRN